MIKTQTTLMKMKDSITTKMRPKEKEKQKITKKRKSAKLISITSSNTKTAKRNKSTAKYRHLYRKGNTYEESN
jgi:hypothetical protein